MQETGQLKGDQCICRLYCRKTKAHQFVICILFSHCHMCRTKCNMFTRESCRQQAAVIEYHENTDICNTGQDKTLQKI